MKRPWNRTSTNVYSLLTYDEVNDLNMNICTYVSAVNMNPRIYAIAIDYKTKTYKNLMSSSSGIVLQCLSIKNLNSVRILGKKSGHNFDKSKYLLKKKSITHWKSYTILKDTSYLIELINPKKIYDMTDHALFLFKIKSYKNNSNDILTFSNLIESKIIL